MSGATGKVKGRSGVPVDPQDVVLSVGRRRILDHLKLVGPSTPAELAGGSGAHHRGGAPASRRARRGRARLGLRRAHGTPGRPAGRWRLTRRAHGLFPDRHGELTAQLVNAIRQVAGDHVLDEVISLRSRAQQRDYETAMAAHGRLARGRAEALARVTNRGGLHGRSHEVTDDGDDLLLVEHHCPICEAAEACAGFCRAELGVFRAVLGDDVSVERTEHLLAGAARCAYRIFM